MKEYKIASIAGDGIGKIVCTATDAFKCFMGTDLDILVCNNFILSKKNQNNNLIEDYKNKYKLD